MRRFMMHLVTEVEFEDGDEASDKTVQNYQKHLSALIALAVGLFKVGRIEGAIR